MFSFIKDLLELGLGDFNPSANTQHRVVHSYTNRTNQSSDNNCLIELLRDAGEIFISSINAYKNK